MPGDRPFRTGGRPKLLMLTRHQRLGSSSRLRLLDYRPYLEAQGWSIAVGYFYDDPYLQRLNAGRRGLLSAVPGALLRRVTQLFNARGFDLLWIEKELFPFLPGLFERLAYWHRLAYVVDYDDATFHRYDQHTSWFIRTALSNKLAPLLRSAAAVTCCNAYLAERLAALGASAVTEIPTVVDPTRYQLAQHRAGDELRIGWIGSPSTARSLDLVREPLEALGRRIPLRLVVIGAAVDPKIKVPTERHPWSEDTETGLLQTLDLGIMPLSNRPWEQGKCGYKLIQYMASGLPVVASAVGANRSVVSAETGFLVTDPSEWLAALTRLAEDCALRMAFGRAARIRAEQHYSIQMSAPVVASVLRSAFNGVRGP